MITAERLFEAYDKVTREADLPHIDEARMRALCSPACKRLTT